MRFMPPGSQHDGQERPVAAPLCHLQRSQVGPVPAVDSKRQGGMCSALPAKSMLWRLPHSVPSERQAS